MYMHIIPLKGEQITFRGTQNVNLQRKIKIYM